MASNMDLKDNYKTINELQNEIEDIKLEIQKKIEL